ncbi:hypothetical protein [Rhodopila globiformis]|uniref:Uncharacterized protein n=1 Tax=Rhodopila globiformis TaxID=1071 RepID=A0A2S6MZS2_RHOGL|nr:hypothetical protein [Rhodopila globiformis]PPQ27849.1 hypothetical protein CCS01_25910 [Rhodopila globiformis]
MSNPEAAIDPASRPVIAPIIDPCVGLRAIVANHLIDLFQGGPVDTNLARQMAYSAIDAYSPQTRADCVNAGRTIAFSIAALALLGRLVRDPMPLPEQLQAFDRANALNGSADKSERTMMLRRRGQRVRPAPAPTPTPPVPEAQTTPAEEAEIKAIVAEAKKHGSAATQPPARPDAPPRGQPTETHIETTLRSYIAAFENPTPETASLRQSLQRNTAMPAMAAQTS